MKNKEDIRRFYLITFFQFQFLEIGRSFGDMYSYFRKGMNNLFFLLSILLIEIFVFFDNYFSKKSENDCECTHPPAYAS